MWTPSTTSLCWRSSTASAPRPWDIKTQRKTEGLMKSPFEFQRHGQSGRWVSELFPHGGAMRRRSLHHPLHAYRPSGARGRAVDDDHRGDSTQPAQHGSLAGIRPGDGKSEPARLHFHLPQGAPPARRPRLEQQLSTGHLFGNLRRHRETGPPKGHPRPGQPLSFPCRSATAG